MQCESIRPQEYTQQRNSSSNELGKVKRRALILLYGLMKVWSKSGQRQSTSVSFREKTGGESLLRASRYGRQAPSPPSCYSRLNLFSRYSVGESPSGKATGSEPVIRGFESLLPSQHVRVFIDPLALAKKSESEMPEIWFQTRPHYRGPQLIQSFSNERCKSQRRAQIATATAGLSGKSQ